MKVVKTQDLPKEPAVSPLFTGDVFRQNIIDPSESTSFNFSIVNFSAGSRNKFHQHTSDQILIVTEGTGVGLEVARLLPNSELLEDWKSPDTLPQTIDRVRSFLQANTPTPVT